MVSCTFLKFIWSVAPRDPKTPPGVTLFGTKKVSNAPPAYDNYVGEMYSLSNTGRPNLNVYMWKAYMLFICGSSTPSDSTNGSFRQIMFRRPNLPRYSD